MLVKIEGKKGEERLVVSSRHSCGEFWKISPLCLGEYSLFAKRNE